MTADFTSLKVTEALAALLKKQGIVKPTQVQEQVIPAIRSGRDVIARAQTGTGKTLAFLLPALERIDPEQKHAQVLVIVPTRELSLQIVAEANKFNVNGAKILAVTGGRDWEQQQNKLKGVIHILVGTPGRLLDHVRKGNVNLHGVTYLVLDEVDEMLEQGFIDDAAALIAMTGEKKQTILCSATLSEEVRKLGKRLAVNSAVIDVTPAEATVAAIKQICVKITADNKRKVLLDLIERYNPYLMLIFCASKERAIALYDWLWEQKLNVDCLHGDLSQVKRKNVMKAFRTAKLQILVATDLAARGLDIEGVTHVVNFDIPHDVDWYVHRIGRTGRAGRDGVAVTLYAPEETKWLKNIEEKLNIEIERQNPAGETLARRTVVRKTPAFAGKSERRVKDKVKLTAKAGQERQKKGGAEKKPARGKARKS